MIYYNYDLSVDIRRLKVGSTKSLDFSLDLNIMSIYLVFRATIFFFLK